jgi:hypothetical protein
MKKYLISYWIERNDEAVDLEKIVEADSILEALNNFVSTERFRKISSISEVPFNNKDYDITRKKRIRIYF